jgi:putative heme-binding domain-containing protein
VGPDLTGMGARPKAELLMEIIDPNRSVEANYRLWTVVRRDGESVSGRLDAETATSVDILDTTGVKHSIQRKDIARIEASQQSIMPSGFDQLPADDLAGILEYIATAGRAK